MRTILRQKYEWLAKEMEYLLREAEDAVLIFPSQVKTLKSELSEIRKIQDSLRIEDKT